MDKTSKALSAERPDGSTDSAAEQAGRSGGSPTASDAAEVESPDRRSAFLRTGFIVIVLLVVFGLILPRFVDYAAVRSALAALSAPQLAVVTLIGVVAWFGCGLLYVAVIPGLTALRGSAAYLILSGIGASVPFGPWNMGVVWVVLRGWGISNLAATEGIALYGIVNSLGRLALPLLAIVFLVIAGAATGVHTTAIFLAVFSTVLFFLVAGMMLAVVRSDRLADWVGRTADRAVLAVLRRLRRAETPDVSGSIHRFRDGIGQVVHRRGLTALVVNMLSQIPWCVLFVVCLRFTGVPSDVLTPPDVVAVFALTSVITLIPIAPGGAGVPELVYITLLTRIAGPGYDAAITAGVFLFRVFVWFLPIPLAWILLKVVRRGRPVLPTATELRAYAGGSGAG